MPEHSKEVNEILTAKEQEQAIQDCEVIIQDCQNELADLKSKYNPLFFNDSIKEIEERLTYFIQLRRRLRNGKAA